MTGDLGDRFAFNTALAAIIELVNDAYRYKDELLATPEGTEQLRFAVATAGSLVFPFAPHLGSEVYELMTGTRVWEAPWPEADPALLTAETFELIVQVNGKLRDRVAAPAGASRRGAGAPGPRLGAGGRPAQRRPDRQDRRRARESSSTSSYADRGRAIRRANLRVDN